MHLFNESHCMNKKNIIIYLIISAIGTGCLNNHSTSAQNNITKPEESIAARDTSINKDNAFNDIFLDSNDVKTFISKENLDDTLSRAILSFYNTRNYEYAWFSSSGLIEQSFSFRSLYSSENDTDLLNKSLENRLDRLRIEADTTIKEGDPSTIKTELQITEKFIQYALKNYADMGISATALGNYIPSRKKQIIAWADSVLSNNSVNNNYAALNEAYRLLKVPLKKYDSIAKNGGWQTIPVNTKNYKAGVSDSSILLIKKRLQITGELSGDDTTELFNPDLENAIKTYQLNHGYKPSGIVSSDLIKDMNITASARVEQLIINMQRMRWMPTAPNGILIIANIPAFEVYVDSGKNILFQMDVVVGAEGHNTTMFSGNVSEIVFSPYWNIPPSIVRKEILPGMKRNKNYLAKKHMEITGSEGGLPVVRQRPGPENALGKVKFLFPNSFNIYMHDTPQKSFFDKTDRSLSHGCIRLSNAPKMADYLLRNSPIWTPNKIDSAMNSGHEKFVNLKPAVPVIITYYTAWVDNKNVLHFADDIYQHDAQMAQKMFTNPQ